MNVNDIITEFVNTRRFISLSDSTKRQYWSALQDIEKRFGNMDVTEVRRKDLIRAHNELSKTPAIANRIIQVASVFFNYAIDMEYVNSNPASRVKRIRLNSLPRWDLAEIDRVIAVGHPVISIAVALAFHTGQRQSDLLNMRWEDVKDGSIKVVQQKTNHSMVIKLSKQMEAMLKAHPVRGPYILSGPVQMSGAAFRNMFKRVTRSVGIELPFHGIRKTVGSVLAERGASTNEIAAILGHRTLEMAHLYTKQANQTKMIASAVNALASG